MNQKSDGIFISKSKYAKNQVKKFKLEKNSHKKTHAAIHITVTMDENGGPNDQSLYNSIIGSLLYLIASRPDISCSVEYVLDIRKILRRYI